MAAITQELASFDTPANVYHQDYTATLATPTRLYWSIECPPQMLLDAEVLVTYTVSINVGTEWGRFYARVGANDIDTPEDNSFIALRQGFTMHQGMIQSDIQINEERVIQPLREYTNVAMRFYATEDEIQNLCSMSGGPLDSGGFTAHPIAQARTIVRQFAVLEDINVGSEVTGEVIHTFEREGGTGGDIAFTLYPDFPLMDEFENPGLTKRVNRMSLLARDAQNIRTNPAAAGNAWTLSDTLVVELTERLPFAPFMTWSTRDRDVRRIHNLRKLEIDIAMSDDPFSYLQGAEFTNLDFTFDWFTVKPVLHCKWIVPSSKVERMPRFEQPFVYYEDYSTTFTFDLGLGVFKLPVDTVEVVLDARMHSTPAKMFIFASSAPQTLKETSDHHLELVSVDLAVDGVPGKLRRLSTPQMFALYLRNSPVSATRRFDYDEWRKRYCTLVLRREDIGWDIENKDGRIMRLTAQVRSWWVFHTFRHFVSSIGHSQDVERTYRLHIMAERQYTMWMDKRQNKLVRA